MFKSSARIPDRRSRVFFTVNIGIRRASHCMLCCGVGNIVGSTMPISWSERVDRGARPVPRQSLYGCEQLMCETVEVGRDQHRFGGRKDYPLMRRDINIASVTGKGLDVQDALYPFPRRAQRDFRLIIHGQSSCRAVFSHRRRHR